MGLYELGADSLTPLEHTTLEGQSIRERQDLQRLLRDQIEVLETGLLVIAEEFGHWEASRRRIDLLAIDRQANLVVIELKRDETGGHMELQALRYAAMVSTMTWAKAVETLTEYLQGRGREEDATEMLLGFLEWEEPDDEEFAQDVRIILAASDFGRELTTAVLWLNQRDLDIKCVRLQPFTDGERVLLNVQQVIPLPEAEDFQIQLREKARKERQARTQNRDLTRFDVEVGGESFHSQSKRVSIFLVMRHIMAAGATPEEVVKVATSKPIYRVFRAVDGTLDEADFNIAATRDRGAAGKTHDAGRWFSGDDELMHSGDKTYALTKMWGGSTWQEAMRRLAEAYPDAGVRFTPTRVG